MGFFILQRFLKPFPSHLQQMILRFTFLFIHSCS